jgi:antitoxin VapB
MKQTPTPNHSDKAAKGTKSARLFRNGANQAIRIPREFELPGTEVMIRKVDGALVIEPIQKAYPLGSLSALLAALATLEQVDHEFPNVDDGLLSLDDVVL